MNSVLRKDDFSKICRICMRSTKSLKYLSEDIIQMIVACASISVSLNDGLPNQICQGCLNKLHVSYDFHKESAYSDKFLRDLLTSSLENWAIKSENNLSNIIDIKPEIDKVKSDVHCAEENVANKSHYSEDDEGDNLYFKDENNASSDYKLIQSLKTKQSHSSRQLRINWVRQLDPEKCSLKDLLCKLCNKKLVNESSLARHMETHDINRKIAIKCDVCNKGFYEKGNYIKHKQRHNREMKYNCDKCPKAFYELNLLSKHLNKFHDVKPIQCTECDKTFIVQSEFQLHMKKHLKKFEHFCTQCGKGYFLLTKLKEHLLIHEQSYVCNICDKTYKSPTSLKTHIDRYHKSVQQRQQCKMCGKTVYHMKAHLLVHNGERVYKCNECQKSFLHRSDLVAHCKRKHRSEEEPQLLPYLCNICGIRKVSKSALEQHLIHVHTLEKSQKCLLCEKVYKTVNALQRHIRFNHKDERRFKCEICSKDFYTNAILRIHMRTHTGERPYECLICGRKFVQNSTMKTHMKVHNTTQRSQ